MTISSAPALTFYRAVTTLVGPLAPALLEWRRRRGKEDPRRLAERMGLPSLSRPQGKLAWLHGASVGEGLALLPLVERLVTRGFKVLVTTGTVTSATILATRLPAGAQHQYVPLDVPAFIRRFLDHWRPDLVLVAESEIWPNMLCLAKERKIPIVLVNARLSPRSYRRWQKMPRLIGALLSRIDLCLAQTQDDGTRLLQLGAPHVQVSGNLKYDVPAPPFQSATLAEITGALGGRPVWLAASTHAGEEEIVVDVHQRLRVTVPNLLTIVAPRHAARGAEIAGIAAAHGLPVSLRSRGDRIETATEFYIADTMGEMGLFYRLASVVLLGKSLGAAQGGQNPIEPAKLGATVLHGPNVDNFVEVYRDLDASHGATEVADAAALACTLIDYLSDPSQLRRSGRAAKEAVERYCGATDRIVQALEPIFLQMQTGRP